MRYLILVIVALTAGCGNLKLTESQLSTEAQVFVNEAKLQGLDLQALTAQVEIRMANLPKGVAGRCVHPFLDTRYIELDELTMLRYNADDKLSVVLHELGHCVLNRPHVAGDSQFADSLMVSNAPTGLWLRLNYKALIAELFSYKE